MRAAANGALRRVPRWAVWLAGLVPLGLLTFDLFAGQLGVDPVRAIEHRLGRTAIYFLAASLAVTPLLRLGRINAMRLRRPLGLLCFTYAVLHVAAWLVFDMGLLWPQIARDLVKRPYLLFGMGGFAILALLAATSAEAALRRLGPVRWRALHRWVYLAAILAALHWLWALKVWEAWPVGIGAAILGLLGLRLLRGWPLGGSRSEHHQRVAPSVTTR